MMYSRVVNDLKENHKRLLSIKFWGLDNSVQKFGAKMGKIKDFALAYKILWGFRSPFQPHRRVAYGVNRSH